MFLKQVEKNRDGFSLDQVVYSLTGHMAWIRTECMIV